MNYTTLIDNISQKTGLSIADTKEMMEDFIEIVKSSLCEGETVNLTGFGILESRLRKEKTAVHPSSGKKLLIPPKVTVMFRPSLPLKQIIKDGQ